jgi:hypothetical protein
LRVAAAHPRADVVVGGTWRWHSWTGDPADRDLDVLMPLPLAPAYTTLEPSRLLHAIYGEPGGGHVPAMCSLLIRREALLGIGGMVADFRDLYEDQVLYVKLGLHLRAVLDPRPLALYRQHPASACSVAITSGTWNPWQASAPGERFFEWMREYVSEEAGPGSPEVALVERNIAHVRAQAAQRWYSPRPLARRVAPRWVHELLHRVRTRPRGVPPTVEQRWSEQVLAPAAATMDGEVLVAATAATAATAAAWTADVPGDAFQVAGRIVRRPLLDAADTFDHVVVPLAAAAELAPADVVTNVARVLRPGGRAVIVLRGRDDPSASSALAPTSASDLRTAARSALPSHHVAVEAFGNAETVDAISAGRPARDVRGVAVDWHDGRTEVLVTVVVEPCRGS